MFRREFMNSQKIMESAKGGPIEVKVYKSEFPDVTPDPLNHPESRYVIEKFYSTGRFFHRESFFITQEQYEDPSFWKNP
jgi:hypothetical protein